MATIIAITTAAAAEEASFTLAEAVNAAAEEASFTLAEAVNAAAEAIVAANSSAF